MVWIPLSEDLALNTICRHKVTLKKPYPKCNTCILGHFESTHVGLSIFIRRSYLKCNTCILGHTKNTHVGFKPSLNEDPTLNAIPTFWVTLK
jgi:hypothetical protein